MKISKLFHWLYFSVMMLPIFILPIFALAVRSDNNYQPIAVQVTQSKVVDFNQLFNSNDVDTSAFGIDFTITNNEVHMEGTATGNFNFVPCSVNVIEGHKYLVTNYPVNMPISTLYASTYQIYANNIINFGIVESSHNNYATAYAVGTGSADVRFRIANGNTYDLTYYPQLFDLTQMGLEDVSIADFKTYFPLDYYPYTLSETVFIENYNSVTYNDTDIGSQMVYTMYQGVNKYFNYDNVINFGTLYSYLETTFFSGTAPLGFFIFWHLLEYWLLTSLLWLLFDVLIYVPMLIHRWLDKASLS